MKIRISRETLLEPLQPIAGVVEKKQTMPVLSNVLMVVDDDALTLTGTNMEVELVATLTDLEVTQPGRITVPARKLVDICRSLPEAADVTLALEGDRMKISAGASQFTLATLPADHFPNVEDDEDSFTLNLEQRDFQSLLSATGFAMAQQDVRYYLNGLLLEIGGDNIRAVATDGHRLAMGNLPTPTYLDEPRQIIVPRKGVQELIRLLDDTEDPVALTIGSSHIRATLGAYTFTSKLIEGRFPDYNRVIPQGGDKTVIADRETFKSILQRAGILSHENIRGVRLELEPGQLHVYANNPDQEQAEDTMSVDYDGEPLQIGFNVGYLIDVMNVIRDEQVRMVLSGSNSSALIESTGPDDNVYVVMPMRL